MTRTQGLGSNPDSTEFHLCEAEDKHLLCFSFLIYKTSVITVPTSQGCMRAQ